MKKIYRIIDSKYRKFKTLEIYVFEKIISFCYLQ